MSLVDDVIQSALPPALLGPLGDPVTLPNGSVVNGVFERYGSGGSGQYGRESTDRWPSIGLKNPISSLPSPSVELRDADAATLAINDRLVIGGAGYLVTATPQPNGSGLTRVELMPERNSDPFARWQ